MTQWTFCPHSNPILIICPHSHHHCCSHSHHSNLNLMCSYIFSQQIAVIVLYIVVYCIPKNGEVGILWVPVHVVCLQCRLCAVFGGIYCLRRQVTAAVLDDNNRLVCAFWEITHLRNSSVNLYAVYPFKYKHFNQNLFIAEHHVVWQTLQWRLLWVWRISQLAQIVAKVNN